VANLAATPGQGLVYWAPVVGALVGPFLGFTGARVVTADFAG